MQCSKREEFMRSIVRGTLMALALVLLGGLTVAIAQQGGGRGGRGGAPQPDKLYTSADEIQQLIATAKMNAKPGQAIVNGRILRLGDGVYQYSANLEYRPMAGPPQVHIHESEIFYVIDGSCTFVTGGKLTEPKQLNPENIAGTAIDGGKTQTLSKGDFLIVPENTPHQVTAVSPYVVFMTLHVPRPEKGTASTAVNP